MAQFSNFFYPNKIAATPTMIYKDEDDLLYLKLNILILFFFFKFLFLCFFFNSVQYVKSYTLNGPWKAV
jgi:hypothetical protein